MRRGTRAVQATHANKMTSRTCTRAVQATHANKMNVSCMHVCSSSCTRQQNERLVHARVQFPMVIRHRSVVRMRKMLRAFLKTCRAVQLLHACVVKFKVSGTVQNCCSIKVSSAVFIFILRAAVSTFLFPSVFL